MTIFNIVHLLPYKVNIPQEAVQSILDAVALGNVARGLFHEATLYIFTCLLYFWKRSAPHLPVEGAPHLPVEGAILLD